MQQKNGFLYERCHVCHKLWNISSSAVYAPGTYTCPDCAQRRRRHSKRRRRRRLTG